MEEMMFDERTEEILRYAVGKSMYAQNEYVTPEHILYAMMAMREFTKAFESMGGDIRELTDDLEKFFAEMLPRRTDSQIPEKAEVSAGFTTVMETAVEAARNSGNEQVGAHHVLWGILNLQESFAVYYIDKQIDDRQELLFRFSELLQDSQSGENEDDDEDGDLWKDYAVRLNDTVSEHNPLIGRDDEIERTIQILLRRDKNNPIFVGEAGVGKTAMAYGLADRIVKGEVPEELKDASVFSLDLSSIVSGTSYRGEFEKKIKQLMDSIMKEKEPIVFLDEIQNLVGAGGLSGGGMDAANILQPFFEDNSIRFMGATTYSEYSKNIQKTPALARRFQKVDIKEPSEAEAVKILEGLKKNYEKFHKVKYGKDVMEYVVSLSKRFVNDKFLPDKAIDLIDEAGAYVKMHPVPDKKTQTVDKSVIEQVLSKTCGIPLQTAKSTEVDALSHLYENITSKVFGQDQAVKMIVDAICMSRAGLNEDDKPVAKLLFVGPTGVGKTEVAKVLAKELGIELVRFDMSEYAEKHTISKLIGSPAGYVGYDEGGLLTDAIRKTPHCVLLLDEIEKAHQDIFNVLLQVMDYASLTDSKGQKADFKNVVIIMTSNAGARMVGKQKIGFGEKVIDDSFMMEEVKKVFSPEFRNRLSGIVTFNHMNREMAEKIVDKKLRELTDKLSGRKVSLTITKKAKDYILKKGITNEYGAREIERVVDSDIKPLFVKEILFGKLKKGGKVKLDAALTGENKKEELVLK